MARQAHDTHSFVNWFEDEDLDIRKIDIETDECKKTVKIKEVLEKLAPFVFMPKSELVKLFNQIMYACLEEVAKGNKVHIPGFGTFTIYSKGTCAGFNPYKGVPVVVPPRRYFRFKTSRCIKRWLNEDKDPAYMVRSTTKKLDKLAEESQFLNDPYGAYEEVR